MGVFSSGPAAALTHVSHTNCSRGQRAINCPVNLVCALAVLLIESNSKGNLQKLFKIRLLVSRA